MLRREQKIKNIILLTLFSIIFIGVGYAIISTSLNIKGNLDIGKITWDVHFENFKEAKDNTVTSSEHNLSNSDTLLSYKVKLNKPGDKYSFTIDVVNKGTIDAMIDTISSSGLTTQQANVIDYSIKYKDGAEVNEKDGLKAGAKETLVVTVNSKVDIDNSMLKEEDENLSLHLNIEYVQDDGTSNARPDNSSSEILYNKIKTNAVLDNINSDFVQNETGIDFTQVSSDTNGKGVYIRAGTQNSTYPIYYYRGEVENNNVIFANYCWKIVRTTDTGGIKMIFNGSPSEDGKCNNTGADSQLTALEFNSDPTSLAHVGYKFGTVYSYESQSTKNVTFAQSVTYADGVYTLQSTSSVLNDNNHYSCGDSSTSCSTIRYYFNDLLSANYIELSDGKLVDDAIEDMIKNTNDSNIKEYIENEWYSNKMTDYTSNIEDTIYCSDRIIYQKNGWDPNGGDLSKYLYFKSYERIKSGSPLLECTNENDRLNVSNKNLIYPVGLLTADEVMLAGGADASNQKYYLYTGTEYWLSSPAFIFYFYASEYFVNPKGRIEGDIVEANYGVRPVISLKHNSTLQSGIGTIDEPYVINQ